MKITRRQLRRLINEAINERNRPVHGDDLLERIILEAFDSLPFDPTDFPGAEKDFKDELDDMMSSFRDRVNKPLDSSSGLSDNDLEIDQIENNKEKHDQERKGLETVNPDTGYTPSEQARIDDMLAGIGNVDHLFIKSPFDRDDDDGPSPPGYLPSDDPDLPPPLRIVENRVKEMIKKSILQEMAVRRILEIEMTDQYYLRAPELPGGAVAVGVEVEDLIDALYEFINKSYTHVVMSDDLRDFNRDRSQFRYGIYTKIETAIKMLQIHRDPRRLYVRRS
jgi:hypothetical protein